MEEPKKENKRKILWWIIGIILLLIIICIVSFAFLFLSVNPDFKSAKLSDSDYFTGARLTQEVLYRTMRSKKDSEVKVLKISNREMQSLMRIFENADSLLYITTGRKPKSADGENNIYKLAYDRGVFSFKIRLTEPFMNLCFTGHGKAEIKYEKGKLDINFLTLRVGRFELPDKYKQMVKNHIYNYLKNNSVYDIVLSSVDKVDFVTHGNVRIHYRPNRLRKHVGNALLQ